MSPALTTFLFEAANFLVLGGVLSWLFFKPVRDAIERRREALKKQTDDAAAKLAEAEDMRSELEQRLSTFEHELEEQRNKARVAAEEQVEQILKSARETAHREADAAKHRLTHLQRSQRQRLARAVAETTGAAVDRLLRQLDQPDLNHALTMAACRQIKAFDGNSLAPVRVESARTLDEVDRRALLEALGQAGESVEFHVIDDLGIGLRVVTNRGLVDVSSTGLSTFAEHQLEHQLTAGSDGQVEGSSDV